MEYRYFDKSKYTPTDNIEIWRYMSVPSLLSLFETSSLYFSPLSSFLDPYEGTLPQFTFDNLWPTAQENYKIGNLLQQGFVKSFTASCWHESTHESEALWRMYSNQGPCVAIQSTYKAILDQMPESVIGIKIRYLDFSTEGIGEIKEIDGKKQYVCSFVERAAIKRKSFEHEKEIRFLIPKNDLKMKPFQIPPGLIVQSPNGEEIGRGAEPGSIEQELRNQLLELTKDIPVRHPGDRISINLSKTIDGILISPFMNDWEATAIEKMISKYQLSATVAQSKLLRPQKFD